jgi:hypothetical protein
MAEDAKAFETIRRFRCPDSDSVHGTDSPLTTLWRLAMVAL